MLGLVRLDVLKPRTTGAQGSSVRRQPRDAVFAQGPVLETADGDDGEPVAVLWIHRQHRLGQRGALQQDGSPHTSTTGQSLCSPQSLQ